MNVRGKGAIRSSVLTILSLIAVAVIVLFALPTPKPVAVAAMAQTKSEGHCLATPAGFSVPAVPAVAPASLWTHWRYGASIALTATPVSALMDQPVAIRVSGLEPGEPVTLHASMSDYRKHTFAAQATFVADAHGIVDVTRQAPRYGSYSGVHAMGLVWAMQPQGVRNPRATGWSPPGATYTIWLDVLADQRLLAHTTLTRTMKAPGVTRTVVHEDGLVGVLYKPASPDRHPAVLVLGGSEGGLYPQVNEAALLASHGYAALGLAYFQGFQSDDPQLAQLPKLLENIPLEYFIEAADWLKRQPGVDPDHVAIMGWSKGAEAALVTAAEFPKAFQGVIGFMPSSVVWAGINYGEGPPSSSWTLHGKPLPWVNPVFDNSTFAPGKPIAFVAGYRNGLNNAAAVAKSVIRAERIEAPVMLISAGDDRIWPSPLMARQLMHRLAARHHAYHDQSFCYAGAGHAILPPWRPVNDNVADGVPGMSFAFGGSPTAYAFADRDAWSRMLTFLHASLGGGTTRVSGR